MHLARIRTPRADWLVPLGSPLGHRVEVTHSRIPSVAVTARGIARESRLESPERLHPAVRTPWDDFLASLRSSGSQRA